MLARNRGMGYPNLITIEDDDDDDVLIYAPNPRSSSGAMGFVPISSSWVPVIAGDDLELRLGSRADDGASGFNTDRRRESLQTCKHGKMTLGLDSSSRQPSKELKLKCAICLDTMEEETSTVCGHVFCRSCILNAIRAQNRCPTCRKVLSISNIHRIYLSGSTS